MRAAPVGLTIPQSLWCERTRSSSNEPAHVPRRADAWGAGCAARRRDATGGENSQNRDAHARDAVVDQEIFVLSPGHPILVRSRETHRLSMDNERSKSSVRCLHD